VIEQGGIVFAKASEGDELTYGETPVILAIMPNASDIYFMGLDGKMVKVPVIETDENEAEAEALNRPTEKPE
jgi:hypothetical protein